MSQNLFRTYRVINACEAALERLRRPEGEMSADAKRVEMLWCIACALQNDNRREMNLSVEDAYLIIEEYSNWTIPRSRAA